MADAAKLAAAKSLIAQAAAAVITAMDAETPAVEDRPQTGVLKNVEIFSVGDWAGSKKVKVDSAMLDEIVSNFNDLNKAVTGFGVPLKIGHLTLPGSPAYGWMSDVRRVGDVLSADFDDVPGEIVDAISKRRYNSVSIELWPKQSFGGKTFQNVLGGVALLGAEWPAVKGLKPPSVSKFSDGGAEPLTLMKEKPMSGEATLKFSQADADALVLAAETRIRVELTAVTAAKDAAEQRATMAETALKVLKEEKHKTEFSAIVDQAIKDGKLLDKDRAQLEAVAGVFANSPKVKVGATEMTGLDLFKAHVASMPKKVTFGEKGARQEEVSDAGASAREELHNATVAFQAANPKASYETAMDAVLRTNADLKNRYAEEGV